MSRDRGNGKAAQPLSRDAAGDLLPAERKVVEQLGHLPLDFCAMAAVSNLFRASAAVRRHMEARVLAADRLSWTSFVALWVLWVGGTMEARNLAREVGVSRPTTTGVVATLRRRGYVRSRRGASDARTVLIDLSPKGRQLIERLFPLFNAQEAVVVASLAAREQSILASMLRSVLRTVDAENGSLTDLGGPQAKGR